MIDLKTKAGLQRLVDEALEETLTLEASPALSGTAASGPKADLRCRHDRAWASSYLAFRFRSAIQARAAATGSGLSRKRRRTTRPKLSTAVQRVSPSASSSSITAASAGIAARLRRAPSAWMRLSRACTSVSSARACTHKSGCAGLGDVRITFGSRHPGSPSACLLYANMRLGGVRRVP
jgi:hypothetical protein